MKNVSKIEICVILVNSKYVSNKKVLGKMKDKFKGEIVYEFVGLKSKMYSLISIDDKEISKAK